MNAMWVQFPTDSKAFFQDGQYMWSNGILFTPVITRGATAVDGYFPTGLWYSLFDSALIDSTDGGQFVILITPLEKTNVHARGGTILTLQNTDNSAMTTTDALKTPITLLVLLDQNWESKGTLYLDDGEQIILDSFSYLTYNAVPVDQQNENDYNVAGGIVQSTIVTELYQSSQTVNSIRIRGISSIQGDLTSAPDTCTAKIQYNGNTAILIPSIVTYQSYSELVLTFNDLELNVVSNYYVSWQCISSKDSKNSSNDDGKGWNAIPSYGQALIICLIILTILAILYFGYRYYYFHTHKNALDPLLPTTDHQAQLSMK